MTVGRLSIALLWAGTLAAQTFIQMSDPQFGMFTKNASFEHETVNLVRIPLVVNASSGDREPRFR